MKKTARHPKKKPVQKKKLLSTSSSSEETDTVPHEIDYERMPMARRNGITSVPKVPDYMLREQALRREQEEAEASAESIEEEDKSLDEVIDAMKRLMIRRQEKACESQKHSLLAWLHENHISGDQIQRQAWRSIFFDSNQSEALDKEDLQCILDTYMTQITQ